MVGVLYPSWLENYKDFYDILIDYDITIIALCHLHHGFSYHNRYWLQNCFNYIIVDYTIILAVLWHFNCGLWYQNIVLWLYKLWWPHSEKSCPHSVHLWHLNWLLPHNGSFMTSQWYSWFYYFIMTTQCLIYDITITHSWQHISIWYQNSFHNIWFYYNINIVFYDITIDTAIKMLVYDIVIE